MKRFILLLNHDDISLSAYLQHCLARGEQFVKVSSNVFTFRKCAPSDERIAVVTYVNETPDLEMKFQLEDYSALMKKQGWRVLQVGGPEDIFDSKRHVFLQTDQSDIPFPDTDPEMAQKAQKRESRSLLRCFVMLLVLAGFTIFFFRRDPNLFLRSNFVMFLCAAAFLFWLFSLIWCIRGTIIVRKKSQSDNEFRNYLVVDQAVFFCMLSVAALIAALLFM